MNNLAFFMIFVAAMSVVKFSSAQPASPDSQQRHHVTSTDAGISSAEFVTNAAEDGLFEVQAAKLALEKSGNQNIKDFAQRMITDHGKANDRLADLATNLKIKVPDRLDSAHQEKLTLLKGKSGADFDQAYATEMRNGHHKAISLFTAAQSSGKLDKDLRTFAADIMPTLKEHSDLAMKLK